MQQLARAFPVLPGKEVELKTFIATLHEKSKETADFFKRYGIEQESWHTQETAHGTWLIVITSVSSERGLNEVSDHFAISEDEFEIWFQAQVLSISGINPRQEPLGPMTECVYRWEQPLPVNFEKANLKSAE